jgi:hypothetical protein
LADKIIGGNMNKIRNGIIALAVCFVFGSCVTTIFSGAAEGVEPGSYLLTAKPNVSQKEGQNAAHKVFKCNAASELAWSCAEVKVETTK